MRVRSAPRNVLRAAGSNESNCRYTSNPCRYSASRAANSRSCAMRMPLVFTMRWRMGRARAVENREEIGMQRRFSSGDLHHVRRALIGDDGVEHGQHGCEGLMREALGAGPCETYRAPQVAVVGDLDQRQAGVLHVVRAQPAVVRAAEFHLRIEALRHLR